MDNNLILIIFILLIIVYSIYIIRYEKRSVKSKLLENAIKISGYKKRAENEDLLEEKIEKRKELGNIPFELPKIPYKQEIKKHSYYGMEYFIINNKNIKNNKYIFYLHGGAYFSNPLLFHFQFLDELSKKLDCTIVMPLYPKSVFSNYKDSIRKVYQFYKKIFKNTVSSNITIMGDSSGGGLALALALMLKEKKKLQPKNIILLSPWLDLTLSNPEILNYEELDPQLSSKTLTTMADLWSKGEDKSNYLLSPINGNLKNLGKISLFVGTHEIFLPDARKFYKKCKENNISINYYEYEKMNHVFVLQPIPEADRAIKQIIEIIKE